MEVHILYYVDTVRTQQLAISRPNNIPPQNSRQSVCCEFLVNIVLRYRVVTSDTFGSVIKCFMAFLLFLGIAVWGVQFW